MEFCMTDSAAPDLAASTVDDRGLRLDEQLCFPLYAASNLIVKAYGPLLKPLGLTYPQYLVMLLLWEQAEWTVGALGKRLHLDSGTLTPMLKRMEQTGLVCRRRCLEDERRVLVSVTSGGAALKASAAGIPAAMACRLAADNEWLARLRADLNSLIELMD
jgi:DNA-binding MarR family transcriptional regulator|tara:strand:+ start:77 stop:556 length:480 start_codon:yes stop_codon:yes gene_type:complete